MSISKILSFIVCNPQCKWRTLYIYLCSIAPPSGLHLVRFPSAFPIYTPFRSWMAAPVNALAVSTWIVVAFGSSLQIIPEGCFNLYVLWIFCIKWLDCSSSSKKLIVIVPFHKLIETYSQYSPYFVELHCCTPYPNKKTVWITTCCGTQLAIS